MAQAGGTSIDLYRGLPQSSRIKGDRLKLTTSAPFAATFVQSQLAATPERSTIYDNRVKNRQIALDNPGRESRAKKLADQRKARQAQDAARRKSRVLSRKESSLRGIWDLKKEETRYELFLPLHRLWRSYMAELLGLNPRPTTPVDPASLRMPNAQAMQAKIVKADFHGSILSVRAAKNPCLVGHSGIVIHETENTFKIVTKDDQLKVIPKHNSVFVLAVSLYAPNPEAIADDVEPMIEFELYGSQFTFRSIDRATRKFKHKPI